MVTLFRPSTKWSTIKKSLKKSENKSLQIFLCRLKWLYLTITKKQITMTTIEEVKDFLRTANRDELNEIRSIFNRAVTLIQKEEKSQFKVGDKVTVVHESRDPNEVFVIEKINRKTISVVEYSTNPFATQKFKVSPNLLKHA